MRRPRSRGGRARTPPGALPAVLAASAGVPVGVLWWLLAPRVEAVVAGGSAGLDGRTADAYIAADGAFAVLALLAGAACGALAAARARDAEVPALLGVCAGGLVAALLAWWLGQALGGTPLAEAAAGAADGTRLEAPLRLGARGVLLLWPIASAVAFAGASAAAWHRGDRDTRP